METRVREMWARLFENMQRLEEKLDRLLFIQKVALKLGVNMANELADLEAAVARNTTVTGSVKALVVGLAERIAAAGTDPAKLAALTASLTASADELTAMVTENTPVPAGA